MNQKGKQSEIKTTKGQVKLDQYIEDLIRNKEFLKHYKMLLNSYKKERTSQRDIALNTQYNHLWHEYRNLLKEFRRYFKRKRSTADKILDVMANKYGLAGYLLGGVWEHLNSADKANLDHGYFLDTCKIDYNDEFYKFVERAGLPITMDFNKQRELAVYPVSLNLHRFTTKRDLLDFIEKRWSHIEAYLRDPDKQKPRFRTRTHDRKLVDFLWKNKQLENAALKKSLNDNFPGNTLVYYEFRKIIESERTRRRKKLNVVR